ncbi:chemoreceptor glutamine deamidase CheD [bacterium]|nr:MAG: chemoreceptor glutamine deamidase CheD [bacterium]
MNANPGFEQIQRGFDPQLGKWVAKILPGEYYVAAGDEAITTVLGSCISACIRDRETCVGGMNHFMLPEDRTEGRSSWLCEETGMATRYGSFAMETLINDLFRRGAQRERMEVKLFGGGRMLTSMTDVGASNIAFARAWLAMEGLHVAAEDVGDTVPRRIIYTPVDGRVRVKRLQSIENRTIATREQNYATSVRRGAGTHDIELFED